MKKLFSYFMFICIIIETSIFAAELHVGSGQTYNTIGAAYDAAWTGDTIVIHEGVYTSFPTLSISDPSRNAITFKRYQEEKVVIDLSGYIYLRLKTGYVFDGLIFDATDTGSYAFYIRDNAHYTQFYNCIFYNTASKGGIYVYGGSGYWVTGLVVENNTFFSNISYGFRASGTVGVSSFKNNLLVSNVTGVTGDGLGANVLVEYSAFWDNTTDISGMVTLGAGSITNIQPIFASTDINDPHFMYLAYDCPLPILKGASDLRHIGARGLGGTLPVVCGDAHTYYHIADIAGPEGIGDVYRDCRVDFYDLAALAINWLE